RSGSRSGARLAPESPADDGAVRPGRPAQHDLLGLFCLARAEIDALAEAHRGTRRAYAPYRAARQPQHRRAIVGGERRLDRGMQMKAHGELDARAAGQLVLAAQIVAVGGQIELARIGQTKARLVQIVPRHEPLMPGFLGAVPMHGRRGLADRAVLLDLDRVGVADNQHRMRRARSSEATPGRLRAAITAAIDDDALALA